MNKHTVLLTLVIVINLLNCFLLPYAVIQRARLQRMLRTLDRMETKE